MITNMIVLLCLSALFPVLMGTSEPYRVEDCSDIYASGYRTSGVYTISTLAGPVQAYCEMESSGNWMVILRRMDGKVDFFRPWESYKKGFGNKDGEHWLGLKFIHQLTRRHQYKLRVDVEDFQGKKAYALYDSFSVDSEADGYRLHVSGFVDGGAGDSLNYHNGMKFSTFDKDQDFSGHNCAMMNQGGFWYRNCYDTNPTAHYLGDKEVRMNAGPSWYQWKKNWHPLKSITMKISRV